MMTFLTVLLTIYMFAAPLILWWIVSVNRRQRNQDLRWHRDSLLAHLRTELVAHENRLAERMKRST